ncbi:hypothetical protein J6590_057101 [Homalodisca vitripennis]|nr:hypothetical protein J6590_057101 [Homalodisca vitripennis]
MSTDLFDHSLTQVKMQWLSNSRVQSFLLAHKLFLLGSAPTQVGTDRKRLRLVMATS